MKKLFKDLVFKVRFLFHKMHFLNQKRKANNLHKLTGKRYHVIPGANNKLMVVDNTFVDAYNKAARFKIGFKKLTIEKLLEMSYYSTSIKS